MYFWNTRQLASDLQEGKVTERQKMWYLFVWVLAVSILTEFSGWPPRELPAVTIIMSIGVVAVNIIGFFLCYRANSRRDDRDFVVRFICMSWPVTWRVTAAVIPVFIFLDIVSRFLSGGAHGPFGPGFGRLTDGADVLYLCGILRGHPAMADQDFDHGSRGCPERLTGCHSRGATGGSPSSVFFSEFAGDKLLDSQQKLAQNPWNEANRATNSLTLRPSPSGRWN
ncbi:MAG: hypothetical protein ACLP5H_01600 [Desulfomonilaceae bacterium]